MRENSIAGSEVASKLGEAKLPWLLSSKWYVIACLKESKVGSLLDNSSNYSRSSTHRQPGNR
jgi:hypothetical protein